MMEISQFIKVIYYQLKHALKKDSTDATGASALLDGSWFSADNFLHHLFKVWGYHSIIYVLDSAVVILFNYYAHGKSMKKMASHRVDSILSVNFAIIWFIFPKEKEINKNALCSHFRQGNFGFITTLWLTYEWDSRNIFYCCKMPQLLMEIFCHGYAL